MFCWGCHCSFKKAERCEAFLCPCHFAIQSSLLVCDACSGVDHTQSTEGVRVQSSFHRVCAHCPKEGLVCIYI